jgi:hypothetical protein
MSGAIPPLPQYAFMAWRSLKAQGQLYLYIFSSNILVYYININIVGYSCEDDKTYTNNSHHMYINLFFNTNMFQNISQITQQ